MVIAGYPAFEIRQLLRDGDRLIVAQAEQILNVSTQRAQAVMAALVQEGFLAPTELRRGDELTWEVTLKGTALRCAKAGKPIKRETADKLLAELLQRVVDVNNGDYAYRVARVIVFGSYLSDRPDLGDIDVGVELQGKWSDTDTYESLTRPRIKAALKAGRRFKGSFDAIAWPQTEVDLILKNRSRALSITGADRIPPGAQTKVIYEWSKS